MALFVLFIYNINALGQTSISTIGKAVTQCNDFEFAKNMLIGDGLAYDETTSNKNYAKFYNPKAQYADKALFVEVYKLSGSNKIEKCVITFYNVDFLSDFRKVGYKYCNSEGLSIEPFQELYEAEKYAMGVNRSKRGLLVATFFRYDQEVEFEHLDVIQKNVADKYNEETNQESQTNTKESRDIVYSIAETPPEFVGGNDALLKYISENTKYPKDAKKNEIQGRVVVQFVVNEDGSVSNIEIKNVLYKSLEEEAIRVISSMPKWNPGTINGNPVKVKYTLPIVFKL